MHQKLRLYTGLVLLLSLMMGFVVWQKLFFGVQLKLQNGFYDFDRPSSEIVVVAIDEKTLAEEALGPLTKWPREHYARLIQTLNTAGAKAIGIDITFPDEGVDDAALAEALKQYPNVILGARYFYDNGVKNAELPNDILMAASPKMGWLNVQLDSDHYIRKLPIYSQWKGQTLEALSFQMARLGNGTQLGDTALYHNEYRFTDQVRIPITPAFDKKAQETVPLMTLNYFSEPGGFARISMIDVLQGRFIDHKNQPVDFANKYVLVGPTALDLQDYYQSPVGEGIRMPGVELHANALQTLLEGAFLKDQSIFSLWLSVLGILLINALLFSVLKVRYAVPIFVLELLGLLLSGLIGYEMNVVVNVFYPFLSAVLSFVGVFLVRYILEARDRKFIQGAFGHYVSPEVVQELLKNPKALELGGSKREITALFSDIANFTTISEGLDPQDLVKFLNEYFTEMTAIVFKHGGTLDKFEGDAIVAFWGAPIEEKNHALKACQAALEMQERLKELRAQWAEQKKPTVHIRIGLNTGIAVVGNMGSHDRFDYTAMGDTVNLASRLEGINKEYGTAILVGEKTFEALHGALPTLEIDSIRVKGKHKAVRAYELQNLAEASQIQEKETYQKALAAYRARHFEIALQSLEFLSKTHTAAKVLKERCEYYLKNPPPADWDGAWTFLTK